MKAVREAVWLLMVVGSVALPSQSQSQSHFRGVVKAKQTTPMYLSEQKSTSSNITTTIASTDIGSNDSGNNTDTSSTASKSISIGLPSTMINNALTMTSSSSSLSSSSSSSSSSSPSPSPSPSSSPSSSLSPSSSPSPSPLPSPSPSPSPSSLPVISLGSTGRNSLTEMIETLPTTSASTSSIAGAELGGASTTESGMSSKGRTTINSSAAPTETSSRTIATSVIEDANTYALSSKKSTSSFNEFMTTPGSVSAKETRESAGKIRPQIKLTTNYTSLSEAGVRLPEGASAALAKPTKYHYYPHNQHIYLLPECAVQQVCNAVYVRLNFTQPLCACPGRYRDPCSASLDSDDLHTTELVTDPRTKALTLVKTCEPVAEMRECRTPRDWSLLALQNIRTGKSHYLVICRCPDANILEGPMSHDQPTYASVPGIRVYGMMCVQGGNRRGRPLRYTRSISDRPEEQTTAGESVYTEKEETDERSSFPWYKVKQLINTVVWD